ncbi:MAG TPA: MFS transporter [Bacteroidota bacterium]|nr:MFS transporter [Bacteroidota bacterium]
MHRTAEEERQDPYAALRYPEFRNFTIAAFLFTVALLIQEVVLGYELYTITKDPLALGLTGLAQAVPFISLSLYGGHLADRLSKRKIILRGVGVIAAGSTGLVVVAYGTAASAISPAVLIGVIYGSVFLIGLSRAFQSPAASSLRSFLVPVHVFENAATWSSSSFQVGAIIGPAIGGFLYAAVGFAPTLIIVVGLMVVSWSLFARVAEHRTLDVRPATELLLSVKEGIRFVWHTKIILYAISLDLFSVLFGGVVAILPIYAQDILKVGSEGLGILRAAGSVGAVATILVLQRVSPMRHAWRNLLIAVNGFGATIIVFALSHSMVLSIVALTLSGAFDSISVVIRQTLLQLQTPDEMRGRVMAVNGIFISSSNELGAFESGSTARLMGVVPSAVFGGIMTLIIVWWVRLKTSHFLNVRLDVRRTDVPTS